MKPSTFIIFLIFITILSAFTGCGSKEDGPEPTIPLSIFEGNYLNTADGTTTLQIDNIGQFYISACSYEGSFSAPTLSGASWVNIDSAQIKIGCLTPRGMPCSLALSEPYLQFNCGPDLTYVFERI